jgi:hypothetical protein
VDVPDERIDRLSGMFKLKKTIWPGYVRGHAGLEGSKSAISGAPLNQLSQMDGFCTWCVAMTIPATRIRLAALGGRSDIVTLWIWSCCSPI